MHPQSSLERGVIEVYQKCSEIYPISAVSTGEEMLQTEAIVSNQFKEQKDGVNNKIFEISTWDS